jgi:chromosome partitioning protein
MKIPVMQGDLHHFDLAQVLQVVSIGRQYTGIELTLAGDRVGTIFVKSGQVVSAVMSDRSGRDAFLAMFPANDGRFFVFRTETPLELPEPLGSLDRLVIEAIERKEQASSATAASILESPSFAPTESASFAPAEHLTQRGVAPSANDAHLAESKSSPFGDSEPPVTKTHNLAPLQSGGTGPQSYGLASSRSVRAPESQSASSRKPRSSRVASGARSLGIVSPKGGSGKSTISLNLALSLARRGHSVVLVDGDVNGDVLSAINARSRVSRGALDVVAGAATVEETLLETVNPRLKLLPAVGEELPDPEVIALDPEGGWPRLIEELERRVDVVLVDTPSGVFGPTRPILGAGSHVLGVLQAEVIAARSFKRFGEGLGSLPEEQRPDVIGVVLNMLQTRHHASLGVFQEALQGLPGEWLFDTTIPRHPAFLESSHQGLPLRHLDEDAPPPVAFLFDNLAGEVAERLELKAPAAKPQAFLL